MSLTHWPVDISTYLRLITGRRGRGLRALLPVAIGLALPAVALLAGASFVQATDARSALTLVRDGSGGGGDLPEAAGRGQIVRRTRTIDARRGPVVLTTIGGPSFARVGLPGMERLPPPGTVLASPSVRADGSDAARESLLPGPISGPLPRALLAYPTERVVVAIVDPEQIIETRDFSVVEPGTSPALPSENQDRLLVALLASAVLLPCAAFCTTAVRVTASRRDGRSATLRLVGMTPRSLRALLAAETGVAGLAAATVVLGGYLGGLAVEDAVVIGDWSAWAEDLRLSTPDAALLLTAATLAGSAVGWVAGRGAAIDPVATRERRAVAPVRRGRWAWLGAALVLPLLARMAGAGSTARLVGIVAALLVGAVGVARCGPLAVRAVGRRVGRLGPATYLGAGPLRLRADESARPVLGVAMVVYALSLVLVTSATFREPGEPAGPADVEVTAFDADLRALAEVVATRPGVRSATVVSSEVLLLGNGVHAARVDVTIVGSCPAAIVALDLRLASGTCRVGSALLSTDRSGDGDDETIRLAADPQAPRPPPPALLGTWPRSATFVASGTTPSIVVIDPRTTGTLQSVLIQTDRRSTTLTALEGLISATLPRAQVVDREAEAVERRRTAERTDTLLTGLAVGLLTVGALSTAYAGWGTWLQRRQVLGLLRTVGLTPRETSIATATTYTVPVLAATTLALASGLAIGTLTSWVMGGDLDLPLARLGAALALGSTPALLTAGVLALAAHRLAPVPPRSE